MVLSSSNSLLATLTAVLLLAAISVFTGCDSGTHIEGFVTDSIGQPVPRADVKLTAGGWSRDVQSDESGRFKIGMTHSPFNPELVLMVKKQGFEPFEKRFHSKEHLESIIVQLVRNPNGPSQPTHPQTQIRSTQGLPLSSACGMLQKEEGHLSLKPLKFLPNESFKGSPVIKFEIDDKGEISNAKVARSSGVKDIDNQVLAAVQSWKYKSQPECGTVDVEVAVTIDWH